MSDDIGLIADTAIVALGQNAAKKIERIAFRLPDSPERAELTWIAEGLRDEEARLRGRIAGLARG